MIKQNALVVAGYYGFGNAGDELILRSLLDRLRLEDPATQITVLSQNPAQTRQRFLVEAVNRWSPWQWIGPFWHARRFILGGGGLLQESTGPWNHFYYLSLVLMAKLFGCQTEVRALGVDPIHSSFNRWWTRFVFNTAVDRASVRDTESAQALQAIGVYRNLQKTPDLIFQLRSKFQGNASNRIAMALSPWRGRPGWEIDIAQLCDRVAELLNVSIDFLVFFPAEDEVLARRAAELAATPIQVRVWKEPEDLLGWIGDYGLVIGMRFHALALASLAEKPFIGWGFQRKVQTICRDFGQPAWAFERGWDADAALRQIGEAWKHRDSLPQRYRPRLPHLKSAVTTMA